MELSVGNNIMIFFFSLCILLFLILHVYFRKTVNAYWMLL